MEHSARLLFLFEKYLHKQITTPELEEMLQLMQEADADALLTPAMQEIWEQIKQNDTSYPVEWEKMYKNISNSEAHIASVHQLKNRPVRFARIMVAAAVLALLAGAVVYLFISNRSQENRQQVVNTRPDTRNEPGQLQTIHLPDGSTVLLNINSKLSYPSGFKGNTREVYLTGEGFFDIKEDARKPFLVHTGNITTKVLGTSFDIKAYPADETVKVTVATGKVQMMKNKKSIGLVAANEQLSFIRKTGDVVKEQVDARTAISWNPGEMIFNDITLQEAAYQLEERFAMSVEFDNALLKNCRITASFSYADGPEQVLAVLCGVTKATYTIQNNKITIYGKGCQ